VALHFRIKWALALAALALLGASLFYADLLRAAFARNPVPRTAQSIERGRRLFQQDCAVCHGERGRGDGPAAAGLRTRLDDLSTIAPPPIFPDGVVAYRIANGADLMPAWKSVLSDNDIWDLINFIRSLHEARSP
jgi:mono/diheme cytochrome c family protein